MKRLTTLVIVGFAAIGLSLGCCGPRNSCAPVCQPRCVPTCTPTNYATQVPAVYSPGPATYSAAPTLAPGSYQYPAGQPGVVSQPGSGLSPAPAYIPPR